MLGYLFVLASTPSPSGGTAGSSGISINLPDVTDHPVLIWVSIIVGGLIIVSTAFPSVLGNVGKGIKEWSDNRRRAGAESDDAQINDLTRQVDYFKKRVDEQDKRLDAWQRQAQTHASWDYTALVELRKTDSQWPEAPAIRPQDPAPEVTTGG